MEWLDNCCDVGGVKHLGMSAEFHGDVVFHSEASKLREIYEFVANVIMQSMGLT